ncbi:MAG: ABC transporter substrate-binding protein [Gordonia sp. (in: high G+C Gram-positive bacteria)]|uniref:ABC transporter substrate-binding protein n=1 Tax=Gordonia sp. (in: high G+C Gram-positive bacteria) TaxID=84139 RepID=UPI003BB51543
MQRRLAALTAAVLLPVAALTACSSSSDEPAPAQRSALPARVLESGTLKVGTEAQFAPMVFTNPENQLTGFDIDLMTAIGEALDVKVDFQQAPFADLLPGVVGTEYDVAVRGIFDTLRRQEQVDMVTYYSAGTQWAERTGDNIDPTDACGKRVAAERGTTQFTSELPAKSDACTDVGEEAIEVVGFDSLRDALTALANGAVDAVSADSPVILYAAKESAGRLQAIGNPFDTQPYGIAVAKGSPLGPVLRQVVQQLIDDGKLKQIGEKWGLDDDGQITTSQLNGATS